MTDRATVLARSYLLELTPPHSVRLSNCPVDAAHYRAHLTN